MPGLPQPCLLMVGETTCRTTPAIRRVGLSFSTARLDLPVNACLAAGLTA